MSHIALSCPFQSDTVTQAFLVVHNLDIFEEYKYFAECPSIEVCLTFPHEKLQWNEVIHFGPEYHRSDIVCFSVHRIRGWMMLIWLTDGDVNPDHLVKVVFTRDLNCNFLFLITRIHSWGEIQTNLEQLERLGNLVNY